MPKTLIAAGWRIPLAAAVLVFCYAPVVVALVREWTTNPLFSYGLAVPFISGYMIWVRRTELREGSEAPDYRLGIPLVLLAAALLIVGHAAAVSVLKGLSLIVSLTALLVLFAGRASLRTMWFPIAYLLLMLPAWDYALHRLHLPSQELSARIAAKLLPMVGVPSLLSGTTIQIPTRTLDVMRECSGVSQLIALMAMVLPAAYLWLGTFVRRAVLVMAAIAIGYLSNGVRITLIGWLAANKLSDGNPEGLLHTAQGVVVAGLGYLAIGACLSLLARNKGPVAEPREPRREMPVMAVRRGGLDAALIVLMIGAGATQLSGSTAGVPLRGDLAGLPDSLNGWTSVTRGVATAAQLAIDDQLVSSEMGQSRFTGADHELLKEYVHSSGATVQVYVGYYRQQSQGKELAGPLAHALHAASSDLRLAAGDSTRIKEIQRLAGNGRGLLFWYHVNGRLVANIYQAKAWLVWDALVHRRTDAAVVLVTWRGGPGAADAARGEAIGLAQSLLPMVRQLLPS
jgi:EpsI family protein